MKNQLIPSSPPPPDLEQEKKRQMRLERFQTVPTKQVLIKTGAITRAGSRLQQQLVKAPQAGSFTDDQDFEQLCQKWQIVGTCEKLEKEYLRLQHGVPPDPCQVRPERVLKQALKHFVRQWKTGQADYKFIQDQLRSIRQDLLIQHIKNKFTVSVYETNARIALQNYDLPHFNQCQQKLYEYYSLDQLASPAKTEFLLYRLLYLSLTHGCYQLQRLLSELEAKDLSHKDIQLGLAFKGHLESGDYPSVFAFYRKGPYMTSYLLDLFVNKIRVQGLIKIAKAFQDRLDLTYIVDIFAFKDEQQALQFLREADVKIEDGLFCTKDSLNSLLAHPLLQKKSQRG